MREPEAAVAIVCTRGPESSILLMRRAEREGDAWSGHWSLPGGRREGSDADLLETALRELQEECGIRLTREQVSASLPMMVARRRTPPFLPVAPFVFDIDAELPTILDVNEAVEALWIPLETVLDPLRHSLLQVPGMPEEMWFPAIALPEVPLWGFTYRLLVEWLGIAPRECASAGSRMAQAILDFLLSRGLELKAPWHANLAKVRGPIPVEELIAHISAPGFSAAHINRLEIGVDYIRICGLAFEEYLIQVEKCGAV